MKGLDLVRAVATDAVTDGELSSWMVLDPLVQLVHLLVDDNKDLASLASSLELGARDDVLLGLGLNVC